MFGHLGAREVESVAEGREAPSHLSSCRLCAQKVRRARARRALLTSLPALELPEEVFQRVERQLLSGGARPRSAPALALRVLVPFALALAAGTLLWLWPSVPPALKQELPLATLQAVMVQGEVHWRSAGGTPRALRAREVLHEGAELDATSGRAALAQGGASLVLEQGSRARLSRLRVGEAELELSQGEATVEQLSVRAGPRMFQGSEALFSVTRFASQVVVEVQRGVVWVSEGAESRERVRLVAPARLTLSDSALLGSAVVEPSLAAAVRVCPRLGSSFFEVVDLPAGAEVQVGEYGWGPAPLSGLFRAGEYRVRARSAGEPEREFPLTLGGQPVRFSWKELVAEEELDPSELTALNRAVQKQVPQLRYCYERLLKKDFGAQAEVALVLKVSPAGEVLSARVGGAALPRSTVDCLVQAARRWKLPRTRSEQELEVPLRFAPGR